MPFSTASPPPPTTRVDARITAESLVVGKAAIAHLHRKGRHKERTAGQEDLPISGIRDAIVERVDRTVSARFNRITDMLVALPGRPRREVSPFPDEFVCFARKLTQSRQERCRPLAVWRHRNAAKRGPFNVAYPPIRRMSTLVAYTSRSSVAVFSVLDIEVSFQTRCLGIAPSPRLSRSRFALMASKF